VTRVFVADPRIIPLRNVCVYFLKPHADVAINASNFNQEVVFGILDVANSEGFLACIDEKLKQVYYPMIRRTKDWGNLMKEPSGADIRSRFLGDSQRRR